MKRFKTLTYSDFGFKGRKFKLQLYVPGINSGAYDKALAITARITDYKTTWWGRLKEIKSHAHMTLNAAAVEQLRDECNKILDLE